MGYYTTYKLSIIKNNGYADIEKIEDDLETISDYGRISIDEYTESMKWYDYDEHMITLSKKHPNVLFALDGTGEESGDIWRSYYCNGAHEHAKAEMVFPSIDEDALFRNATSDRIITHEEYKNAVDAISRAENTLEKANDLIKRYNNQK